VAVALRSFLFFGRMATKVDPSHLRDAQDAVTVNYILAGWLPDHGDGLVPEGLWTLEITEHALARTIWRATR
jgi:hypothetical protein